MQRRTLSILVGENWLLSHVCDLFERIASKYTSADQPRGLLSLFPTSREAQYSTRDAHDSVAGLHEYFKDDQSERAFSAPLGENTEMKVYIAGHGYSGCKTLASIHANKKLRFRISVQAIASRLHQLFQQTEVQPTSTCPVKISLIACAAAVGHAEYGDAFAIRLLQELNTLGHNHILVKAYEKKVLAPFFGNKLSNGKAVHFYLENQMIYMIDKDNDLRKQVLKALKKCCVSKGDYFDECIQQINQLGISVEDQREIFIDIIVRAMEHSADGELVRAYNQLMRVDGKYIAE